MPPKKKVQKPMTALESLRGNNAIRYTLFHYGDGILRDDRREALTKNKEKVEKLVNRAVPYLSK